MVGKTWSLAEEKIFWRQIVPLSDKRVQRHLLTREKSWDELASLMQQLAGAAARREYSGQSLYEHFFLNIGQRRPSPNALVFVNDYLTRRDGPNANLLGPRGTMDRLNNGPNGLTSVSQTVNDNENSDAGPDVQLSENPRTNSPQAGLLSPTGRHLLPSRRPPPLLPVSAHLTTTEASDPPPLRSERHLPPRVVAPENISHAADSRRRPARGARRLLELSRFRNRGVFSESSGSQAVTSPVGSGSQSQAITQLPLPSSDYPINEWRRDLQNSREPSFEPQTRPLHSGYDDVLRTPPLTAVATAEPRRLSGTVANDNTNGSDHTNTSAPMADMSLPNASDQSIAQPREVDRAPLPVMEPQTHHREFSPQQFDTGHFVETSRPGLIHTGHEQRRTNLNPGFMGTPFMDEQPQASYGHLSTSFGHPPYLTVPPTEAIAYPSQRQNSGIRPTIHGPPTRYYSQPTTSANMSYHGGQHQGSDVPPTLRGPTYNPPNGRGPDHYISHGVNIPDVFPSGGVWNQQAAPRDPYPPAGERIHNASPRYNQYISSRATEQHGNEMQGLTRSYEPLARGGLHQAQQGDVSQPDSPNRPYRERDHRTIGRTASNPFVFDSSEDDSDEGYTPSCKVGGFGDAGLPQPSGGRAEPRIAQPIESDGGEQAQNAQEKRNGAVVEVEQEIAMTPCEPERPRSESVIEEIDDPKDLDYVP